ncbi:hypothetical protein RND81_07G100400 [Saponaria officinalis]|uniref:Uncharacterized protein n=1 Tax=Saponaria officinalis TaxID=3572 RepID=A0AAW1JTK9_SAPOF
MEIRKTILCSSTKEIIHLGRRTHLDRQSTVKSRLRYFWRKLTRQSRRKIKIFDCCTTYNDQVHLHGYDPYTYAQNFDQGLICDDEVDNLSRTFSMRFAAPRKLIHSDNHHNCFVNDDFKRSFSDVGRKNHDVLICFLEGQ